MELSILVVSCDKYADLWPVFFNLFNKYWAKCSYNVYLGSNYKTYNGVRNISIHEDKSWTENVKNMLVNIDSNYVILLLEDFFITDYVDESRIEDVLAYVKDNQVDIMRLWPVPKPEKVVDKDKSIGLVRNGSPYCISTMPAIWKKDVLLQLLEEKQSAWEFEQNNSKIASAYQIKIMSTMQPCIKIINGVERGKWYKSSVNILRGKGITINTEKRGCIDDTGIKRKIWLFCYNLLQNIRGKL